MKISICGSRGIPNNYGGYEQCAERLATALADSGHEVIVYNPEYHPYKDDMFGKVHIEPRRQADDKRVVAQVANGSWSAVAERWD